MNEPRATAQRTTRTRTRRALAWAVLAGLSFVATDCSIDAICQEGAVGCAVDPCANHERDGDETDVDCGGACSPCASGQVCHDVTDCASNRCFGGVCCEPPCVIGATRFGGPDFDHVTSAVYLPDGTLVLAGEMHGSVDFGGGALTSAGGTDVFVVALAPGGSLVWQRRFGGSKEDGTPVLAVTPSGHLWVAGIFQSKLDTGAGVLPNSGGYADIFVVELDGAGNTVQAKAFSSQGTSVGVRQIAATADGGLVICGALGRIDLGDGTVLISDNGPFPGGPTDVYLAKLDAHLDRVWDRQLGNADNDFTFGFALDPAGNVVLGLTSTSETSFGGPPLDQPGNAIVSFAGADGAYQWGKSYGTGFGATSLSIDADGDIFMNGDLTAAADLGTGKLLPKGTRDALVARLDAAGEIAWVKQLPSDIESYSRAVMRDPGGGVFVALGVTGDLSVDGVTAATGADSLVFVRLDADGNAEWARNVGGIVLQVGVGLAPTPAGYVLAYGGYAGALDLGDIGLAQGSSDAFYATLLP